MPAAAGRPASWFFRFLPYRFSVEAGFIDGGKQLRGRGPRSGGWGAPRPEPHQFPASSPDRLPVGALQEEGLEQARKIREQLDSRPKGQKPHK